MVSKKDIKDYDFNTIEDYYQYIVLSEYNGQRKQVKDLISKLSKKQKKDCLEYLEINWSNNSNSETIKTLIIESFSK